MGKRRRLFPLHRCNSNCSKKIVLKTEKRHPNGGFKTVFRTIQCFFPLDFIGRLCINSVSNIKKVSIHNLLINLNQSLKVSQTSRKYQFTTLALSCFSESKVSQTSRKYQFTTYLELPGRLDECLKHQESINSQLELGANTHNKECLKHQESINSQLVRKIGHFFVKCLKHQESINSQPGANAVLFF